MSFYILNLAFYLVLSVLMKVYRCLDKSKYQMDFAVAISTEGKYDAEILSLGGKIFHITPKKKSVAKNFMDIYQIVKANNYKSVLRVSQHSLSALELLAAKMGGAEICGYRSSNTSTPGGSRKSLILHHVFLFMPQIFTDVRYAPSTEAAEYMFGKNCVKNHRAEILKNGLDLRLYKFNMQSRDKIRKEFGIKDSEILLGHIGRFNQQKNHHFLITLFEQYRRTNPNSRLILVGKGEMEGSIKKQVKEMNLGNCVIFAGVRSDVPQLLSALDILLLPSLYEGMPNVVIEAQANGCPCVISDSITKEAKVTDLVEYASLDASMTEWISKINMQVNHSRRDIDTSASLKNADYDIHDVTKRFAEIQF